MARKPSIVWPLGPKALHYESLEPQGNRLRGRVNVIWAIV